MLQHCVHSEALLSKRNATNQTRWELMRWNGLRKQFEPLSEPTRILPDYLLVTDRRLINETILFAELPDEEAEEIHNGLAKVFGRPEVLAQIPDPDDLDQYYGITCPGGCTPNDHCRYLYDTFFESVTDPNTGYAFSLKIGRIRRLSSGTKSSPNASQPQNFQCIFKAVNATDFLKGTTDRACSYRLYPGEDLAGGNLTMSITTCKF